MWDSFPPKILLMSRLGTPRVVKTVKTCLYLRISFVTCILRGAGLTPAATCGCSLANFWLSPWRPCWQVGSWRCHNRLEAERLAALLTDERKHLVPKSAISDDWCAKYSCCGRARGIFFPSSWAQARARGTAVLVLSGCCAIRSYFIDQKAHF